MMSVNIFAFLFSALLIHKIIVIDTNNEELAVLAVVLFGFWPLVGLPYAVDPLADLPAMFLFLVGLYLLLRSHRLWAALFFGFSLITHKAMWIFVGILILVDWFYQKNRFEKQNILFFGILFMPLGLLWLSGSFYHGSPLWLFSSNLKVEITSKSTLPILDGLLGTILGGGIKGTIKGGILTVFACISALSALLCLRLRPKNFQYGLAISLAIFILFLLNQHEIWAAMRFGRLLAIPLALLANKSHKFMKMNWHSPLLIITVLVLFISQFVYSWYMAIVYFG